MSRFPLDGRYAPITSELGFLEQPLRVVVDAYVDWAERREREPFVPPELEGTTVETYYGPDVPPEPPPLPPGEPALDVHELDTPLPDALERLLPLRIGARRFLFVPTASSWTAYFDNGWRGTDAFPPMSYLALELGCRGLRVVARADAALVEVYGARDTEWLNVERAVGAMDDGGRWRFVDEGRPLAFEDTDRYRARRIRDRFSHDALAAFLAGLGIRAFDDDFYRAPAILLQKRRQAPRDDRDISLEEARAAEPVPPPLALPPARGRLSELVRRLGRRRR
jgi:hypothetical protein